MRFIIPAFVFVAFALASAQAQAAASCSSFAVIKSYDANAKLAEVDFDKGKERRYFPKPDGTPTQSKLPKKCSRKLTKKPNLAVNPTGGRMSVTQVRMNSFVSSTGSSPASMSVPKMKLAWMLGTNSWISWRRVMTPSSFSRPPLRPTPVLLE